jgi:hypothetical protein
MSNQLFEQIYKSGNADFFHKNWARVQKEPTFGKKASKFMRNFFARGGFWDDVLERYDDVINEPGISKAESMKRSNDIISSFKNVDGNAPLFSDEEIEAAEGEDNG